MIPRNGDHVAERLLKHPLHRPDLDLFFETSDESPAAYGMFWWHPATVVGLVEPMRTMDQYQRLGLARHILTTGLDRLAALGAMRFKIGYSDNPALKHLYLSVGFRPQLAVDRAVVDGQDRAHTKLRCLQTALYPSDELAGFYWSTNEVSCAKGKALLSVFFGEIRIRHHDNSDSPKVGIVPAGLD